MNKKTFISKLFLLIFGALSFIPVAHTKSAVDALFKKYKIKQKLKVGKRKFVENYMIERLADDVFMVYVQSTQQKKGSCGFHSFLLAGLFAQCKTLQQIESALLEDSDFADFRYLAVDEEIGKMEKVDDNFFMKDSAGLNFFDLTGWNAIAHLSAEELLKKKTKFREVVGKERALVPGTLIYRNIIDIYRDRGNGPIKTHTTDKAWDEMAKGLKETSEKGTFVIGDCGLGHAIGGQGETLKGGGLVFIYSDTSNYDPVASYKKHAKEYSDFTAQAHVEAKWEELMKCYAEDFLYIAERLGYGKKNGDDGGDFPDFKLGDDDDDDDFPDDY